MRNLRLVCAVLLALSAAGCASGDDDNAVSWRTEAVSLDAEDFRIIAGDETFLADVNDFDVHSDPGSEYCTLELQWEEDGAEMRLYIYFVSDGTDWWADEIRTYDGDSEDPEWVYYKGTFFKSELGSAFEGDFSRDADNDNETSGSIHFEGLRLQAFLSE